VKKKTEPLAISAFEEANVKDEGNEAKVRG
jgi:hypothetical protein